MGFSGGGSNVTKAHTHSSSIVQDGGSLAFNNITQAGMSAGDLCYSNGTALQVLGIGSATDTLTVNGAATAPEWVAAAGGSAAWAPKESFTAAGVGSSEVFTFTSAFDFASYAALRVDLFVNATAGGNWDLDFRWNDGTLGSTINGEMTEIDSGASSVVVVTNDSYFPIVKTISADSTVKIQLFFYYNPHDNAMNSGTMQATIPEERRSKSGSFWAESSYSTITDFKISVGGATMTGDTTIETYTLAYS